MTEEKESKKPRKTQNKTQDEGKNTAKHITNSKVHDSSSKIIFGNAELCSQFLRNYMDMPILKDIKAEDIEDVTERYIPMFTEERNSDTVKRIKISENTTIFFISLIEHKTKVDYNITMQLFRYMVYIWEDYEKEMEKKQNIGRVIEVMLRHINVPEEEVAEFTGQVKEKKMGQLFECFEEYDVQATRREAKEEGRELCLISQVCKKLAKGKSIPQIADDLEEDTFKIEKICRIIKSFDSEYNDEDVLNLLKENK